MSNDMKAYTISIFMVFLTFAIKIIVYLSTNFFPGINFAPTDDGGGITYMLSTLVLEPTFSPTSIVLFTFSLLIMQFVFIKALFVYGAINTAALMGSTMMPIPDVFKAPLIIGTLVVAYIGIMQMSSRQTVQGA